MNPDFITLFNSYKIYHITDEEYEKFREEEEKLCIRTNHTSVVNRRFFLFKNQHFTYCRQALEPLIRIITTTNDDTYCSWFHSRREPLHAAIAYVSNEYRRIIKDVSCDHHTHNRTESIISKIIVSKYWDELQVDVIEPIVAEVLSKRNVEIALTSPFFKNGGSQKIETMNSQNSLKDISIGLPSKKKKKSIPLSLKRKVWNDHIGESIGKARCVCCKLTDITQMSFSCGHVIAEINGGALKLDNLRPICISCNSSMGTKNMDEFISEYGL